MTPPIRKLAITAHVAVSVGWLGATAAFLALSIIGLTSRDADVVRGAYFSMNVVGRFVIIPMCFAALGTGLLQSLGTPWGLLRHYWISVKFGLTVFATIALLVHQFGVISVTAKAVMAASSETLFSSALNPLKVELVRAPAISIVLLLTATALGTYKPWGLTSYGRRNQQQRYGASELAQYGMPLGIKIVLSAIGALAILFVVLHLAGHGFGNHSH
jgi:hypothetical protein